MSHQNDSVSCGWRVCLNAILLLKIVLDIEVFFYLFNQPKISFNILDMMRALKGIFYMQVPLNISNNYDLDLEILESDGHQCKWLLFLRPHRRRGEDGANLGTTTN